MWRRMQLACSNWLLETFFFCVVLFDGGTSRCISPFLLQWVEVGMMPEADKDGNLDEKGGNANVTHTHRNAARKKKKVFFFRRKNW